MTRPRPAYRRMAPDERRAQILGVAGRMFSELPYAEVSTAAIADEAGVRRGLIHYYFGTKRDLFLEVVRDLTVGIAGQAPPRPPAGTPLVETVGLCVDVYLDACAATGPTWFAAVDAEGFGQDPELRRIIDRAKDVTIEHLLSMLGLPDASRTLRAVLAAYSGLADQASRQWLQKGALTRAQTHTLLSRTLQALVADVAPELECRP